MAILRHSQPDQRERRSVGRAARLTCGPPAVARLRCPKRAICGQPRTREEMACHWARSFCRGCNAFVISFHITFPAFTIGLADWLATIEGVRLATGNPVYRRVFDFWLRIFALQVGYGRTPTLPWRHCTPAIPLVPAVRPTVAIRPLLPLLDRPHERAGAEKAVFG
jgi:Cytochrome bd terminal oxidase subunit I